MHSAREEQHDRDSIIDDPLVSSSHPPMRVLDRESTINRIGKFLASELCPPMADAFPGRFD